MKNVSLAINGVLAVAIIILFVLFFKNNSYGNDTKPVTAVSTDSLETLPIAYVNVDSLLANYNFAKIEMDRLMNKFKSVNSTVTQKQRQLQNEVAGFHDKIQKNLFLSQDKAQQEQQRLQKLEVDLGQMAQRMESELAQEELKINEQIADSVRLVLKEYNSTANYQIIFSNKGLNNVLIAKEKYDITKDIITILNNRYKPATPAK